MFNKIKHLKELRNQAKTLQNGLAQEKVEIEYKGIKLVMDGNQEIVSLDISQDLLNTDKKQDLEEYIKESLSQAIKKVQRVMAEKMQSMGGLNLPGM